MKKRIIAAVLAAVVALNLCSLRPKAEAATVAVIGIGIMAWQLLGVMNGNYDGTAKAIGELIESGVDAFTNPDSTFQTEYVAKWIDGWRQIFDKLTEWVDDYTITVSDDGKVRMKYSQYLELCGLVGNAYADVDLNLTTDYQYLMFKAEPNVYIHIDQSVSMCSAENLANGIHYAPVLYDDENNLYFSDATLHLRIEQMDGYLSIRCGVNRTNLQRGYFSESYSAYSGSYFNVTMNNFFEKADMFLTTTLDPSLDIVFNGDFSTKKYNKNCSINWYQFDEVGNPVQINDVDISSLHFAYINVACGDTGYADFLKSISAHSTVLTAPALDDLSKDLSPILDKTKDPTLEIDTDPSIATPADAVTVTDIPGTADVTIAQLREKTNVDIDIPSVISTKFPFCIPFDFIRIIGVLCADPVAPVFRIPISTNPDNLKGFEGNQTIGELPEDFTPMFEIDEELVIDLSAVPLVQPICYTVFIISFVVLLIFSTNKMINH